VVVLVQREAGDAVDVRRHVVDVGDFADGVAPTLCAPPTDGQASSCAAETLCARRCSDPDAALESGDEAAVPLLLAHPELRSGKADSLHDADPDVLMVQRSSSTSSRSV
jgi:hypothetical protein